MKFERPDGKGIDRRDALLSGVSLVAASTLTGEALVAATTKSASAQQRAEILPALPSDQIGDIATSAYLYAYPLIIMEITRRLSTNVADTSRFGKAPMNQFGNLPAFPDATFTDVVRPNADTLYSFVWFDVSKEPLLISVPDSGRTLLSVADARHVDRRFRVYRRADDRDKRAASCPRRAGLAGPRPCGRGAHS